jgi:hypothetical protein
MAQSQILYSAHSQGCNINKYCITNYLSKPSILRLVLNTPPQAIEMPSPAMCQLCFSGVSALVRM